MFLQLTLAISTAAQLNILVTFERNYGVTEDVSRVDVLRLSKYKKTDKQNSTVAVTDLIEVLTCVLPCKWGSNGLHSIKLQHFWMAFGIAFFPIWHAPRLSAYSLKHAAMSQITLQKLSKCHSCNNYLIQHLCFYKYQRHLTPKFTVTKVK